MSNLYSRLNAQELVLTYDLIVEVLICLPSIADVGRACAVCASFLGSAASSAILLSSAACARSTRRRSSASTTTPHPSGRRVPPCQGAPPVRRRHHLPWHVPCHQLQLLVRDILDGRFLLGIIHRISLLKRRRACEHTNSNPNEHLIVKRSQDQYSISLQET